MKNILFLSHIKSIIQNKFSFVETTEKETQQEVIKTESIEPKPTMPLNIQLIDIDKVFAN